MRVLLVDHHDSFTWNLAHQVAEHTGHLPEVIAHDDEALRVLDWSGFDAVILSPGPGRPERPADARFTADALVPGRPPVLGVCLGMQLMAHHAGGRVVHAPSPRHGRLSPVHHDGTGLFAGVPSPTELVRYHSLACVDLPDTLLPLAWATDDGVLMALRHVTLPWWGVQFHPESIASEWGARILGNFLSTVGGRAAEGAPAPRSTPPRLSPPMDAAVLHAVVPGHVDPEWLHTRHFRAAPTVWLDGAAASTRWSILGDASGPLSYTVSSRDASLTIGGRTTSEVRPTSVLDFLRSALAAPRPPVADLPFALGFVGAFGYELDAELLFLDRAVVIDHLHGISHLLALEHPANRVWIDAMSAALAAPDAVSLTTPPRSAPRPLALTWRHDRAAYRERVLAAQALLRDGESYELCLTNQVRFPYDVAPIDAFRALRRGNPAPFAALLDFGAVAVVSSSPERFLRVTAGGEVTAQPIKGTRRREAEPLADAAAAASLARSEKDRSENLMIVDLLRNDLGRVCEPGTVAVPSLYAVESFATVHQLVSTVTGRLRAGLGAVDVLDAAFPPGSMTGAPKARSVALLAALEGGPRGLYSGVVGYLSLCGAADLSVLIRAAVIADGEASVGVGGAVVALSDPDAEVDEMELKAAAVLAALSRA